MLQLSKTILKYIEPLLQSIHQTIWLYKDDEDFTVVDYQDGLRLLKDIDISSKRSFFNDDNAFFMHQLELKNQQDSDFVMEYDIQDISYKEHIFKIKEETTFYLAWLECNIKQEDSILEYLFLKNLNFYNGAFFDMNLTKGMIYKWHTSYDVFKQYNVYQDFIEYFKEKRVEESYQSLWLSELSYEALLCYFENGNTIKRHNSLILNHINEYRWMEVVMIKVIHPKTKETHIRLYIIDKDKEVREFNVLRDEAERDCLTGLYNRKACEVYINQWIKKYAYQMHAFMIVDIDLFKQVNDQYGHYTGDQVLIEFGQLFMRLFRKEDIMARIGGDEFVVFLKNISSKKIAEEKANELRLLSHQLLVDMQIQGRFTVSIGLAITPQHGNNYIDLMCHADQNLYYAKNNGRDQVIL